MLITIEALKYINTFIGTCDFIYLALPFLTNTTPPHLQLPYKTI